MSPSQMITYDTAASVADTLYIFQSIIPVTTVHFLSSLSDPSRASSYVASMAIRSSRNMKAL